MTPSKTTGAGQMRERVHFQRRQEVDDGFGNVESGDFETVFTCAARLSPMRGSETVIASRLQGVQPYRITIRSSAESRAIGTGWRIVDARSASRLFEIRSVANADEKDAYLEIIAAEGTGS